MMLEGRTQGGRELGEAGCRSLWWALEHGVAVDLRHIEMACNRLRLILTRGQQFKEEVEVWESDTAMLQCRFAFMIARLPHDGRMKTN